jgi:hypothetical protein
MAILISTSALVFFLTFRLSDLNRGVNPKMAASPPFYGFFPTPCFWFHPVLCRCYRAGKEQVSIPGLFKSFFLLQLLNRLIRYCREKDLNNGLQTKLAKNEKTTTSTSL